MSRLLASAVLLSLTFAGSDAAAGRGFRFFGQTHAPVAQAQPPAHRASRTATSEEAARKQERQIARRYLERRTEARRNSARFFEKITVGRDYRGEYVLHRDAKVTAFLDLTDPRHPKYDPKRENEDEAEIAAIPPARRVHVLVVPNAKREHIGARLGGAIGRSDLEATLEVVKAAEALATKMGVVRPKIFINSEANIGVGYLHVHILGERGPNTTYPAAL